MPDRILTTHAGSLPRPRDLVRMMWDLIDGKDVDPEALDRRIVAATREVVERQLELGLDFVSDGEMSKTGFSNYIHERFSGFDGSAEMAGRDLEDFPELAATLFANDSGAHIAMYNCVGPIELTDTDAIHRDIARFKEALGDHSPARAFMCAVTPGQITFNHPNKHYPTHEEYLEAAAAAMRHEYRAIADAGLQLQLDAPDLAMAQHFESKGSDLPDFHSHLHGAIDALNDSLEGIDPSQVRLHVCWGNYAGPHHRDVPLRDIIGELLRANVGVLSFEAANPRHAHEWEVFEEVSVPDHMSLLPGLVDVQATRIEHPRLIAQRLERFAQTVGRERVLAGTDCGFGTFVGLENIDPEVGWAKLGALVEGARLASERLW